MYTIIKKNEKVNNKMTWTEIKMKPRLKATWKYI